MFNSEITKELYELSSLYEERWGKEVDYLGLPSNCSQEMLVQAMKNIVDTGESVLCGLKTVRDLTDDHNEKSYQD